MQLLSVKCSVIDEKGIVQYLNAACERTSGYSKSEILGKNVKLMMPEEVIILLLLRYELCRSSLDG